jgi:ABC-type transport system involved in multi-copper enzyme maturation permease subunit
MSASSGQGPAILAAERPAWPAARGPVPGLWRFFASELKLVFGRPRNRAMLAVLAVLPIGFGILFRLTINSVSGSGGNGPPFLNELAGNGVFLALVVLTFMLSLLLLPLAAAVVAGDAIAGEASLGTLRGLLTVPAGRVRLLAVKYLAMVVYCLAACLVVTVVALIMGLLLFPAGPVTTLSGTTIGLGTGVLRVLVIAVYAAAALASLGAIGLAASTLTPHPVGTIVAMLVVVVGSEIADQVPQLSAIHAYLPTHFWLAWDGLFRAPVGWSGVTHGLLSFAVYFVIFGAVAWARFTSADITS